MNELIQSATFDDRYKLLPGEQHQEKWSRRLAAMIPEQRNFLKAVNERRMPGTGNGSWLLVGNSHADVISRELQAEYHEHFSLFQMFTVPGVVTSQKSMSFFISRMRSFLCARTACIRNTRPCIAHKGLCQLCPAGAASRGKHQAGCAVHCFQVWRFQQFAAMNLPFPDGMAHFRRCLLRMSVMMNCWA